MVWTNTVPMTSQARLTLGSPGPCVNNAPIVDYDVGYYEFDVALPPTPGGYTIAYQRCCRIAGINNVLGSSNIGATYTAIIPGTSASATGPVNNSARFTGADTVIVCAGGGQGQGVGPNSAAPNPPAAPPYASVPYSPTYNSTAPLGANITINSATGLISGIAPPIGIYVVTVCVSEIRDGVVIATQRKDLQIKAGDCDVASATLNPEYISCDGFTVNFANLSNSPLINAYTWSFGDPASGANNTSNLAAPVHTFSTAGDYTIKLITNPGQECSDSTTAIVKVWPGFFPEFSSSDNTTTVYGVVDSWRWDFGEATTIDDTSRVKNPSWTYPLAGPKDVRLIVTNSKGCVDTINHVVDIIDKPPITLAFRDTLICVPDAVQLQASGTGTFSWSPNTNIINANTATPTVNPDDWNVMIDTNVKGFMYVAKAVSQLMVKRKQGHIINMGSIAGKQVYEKGNAYCASKYAVDALNQAMRIDLLRHNIKVTGIHPGAAETEFSLVRFKGDADTAKKIYDGLEPLSPEDVADV
ncbi:PKD domain protein, partial [Ostertagia ostertagi]